MSASASEQPSFPIFALPNELQAKILSFLPDAEDQINISRTCKTWHNLVMYSNSFVKSRYLPLYSGISHHFLLENQIQRSALLAFAQGPKIEKINYVFRGCSKGDRNDLPEYQERESYPWRAALIKDITSCPFLDESVFSTKVSWITWEDVCNADGSFKGMAGEVIKPKINPHPWGDRRVKIIASLQTSVGDRYSSTISSRLVPVADAKTVTVRELAEAIVKLFNGGIPTASACYIFWVSLNTWTDKEIWMDVKLLEYPLVTFVQL
ncbi:hypothetical protein H072_2870 [Dactylellina haptotyla CBS 200.50]|uniref:F-box domain-containing protein n=1 Tax=Dactylellina haptotyla (strain CBS 200.50) TaxID=1284197 RepID=S8BUH9_DACHA|nr:hypothetical protein H072_2870 [Dactylellina haptotyla CBS 200.50]